MSVRVLVLKVGGSVPLQRQVATSAALASRGSRLAVRAVDSSRISIGLELDFVRVRSRRDGKVAASAECRIADKIAVP